jgi:hypothetical protein
MELEYERVVYTIRIKRRQTHFLLKVHMGFFTLPILYGYYFSEPPKNSGFSNHNTWWGKGRGFEYEWFTTGNDG